MDMVVKAVRGGVEKGEAKGVEAKGEAKEEAKEEAKAVEVMVEAMAVEATEVGWGRFEPTSRELQAEVGLRFPTWMHVQLQSCPCLACPRARRTC